MFVVMSYQAEGAPEASRRYLPQFSTIEPPLTAERLAAAATPELQDAQLFAMVPVQDADETRLRFMPALPAGFDDWQVMAVHPWLRKGGGR